MKWAAEIESNELLRKFKLKAERRILTLAKDEEQIQINVDDIEITDEIGLRGLQVNTYCCFRYSNI
jgi:hypothetical protein